MPIGRAGCSKLEAQCACYRGCIANARAFRSVGVECALTRAGIEAGNGVYQKSSISSRAFGYPIPIHSIGSAGSPSRKCLLFSSLCSTRSTRSVYFALAELPRTMRLINCTSFGWATRSASSVPCHAVEAKKQPRCALY